ncbi:MAG TPA: DUF2017 family protein [Acidimicrobiia bacterium]|nr:DUF2017 family protein [Acidimicrobiia bacterium]
MSPQFERRGEGIVVTLDANELELLRSIPDEVRGALERPASKDDPVYNRLFPSAYLDPTEESAEQEWQELVHPELLQSRLAALELVTTTLDRAVTKRGRAEVELTPEEVEAWLGVVNDARLTLGTRLGVTEDAESEAIDPSDPSAPAHAVYGWLTWFENDLVETLLG